jgi:hypothetical protein
MIDLRVDFGDVVSYLEMRGWARSEGGHLAELWEKDDIEVLVPRVSNAPDYGKRVEILVDDLQRFEGRPGAEIASEMARQFYDVTDVRADHEYGEACIPLDAGQKLFSAAKGLIVSATASTLRRRGYFGRSMPKRAREQAKKALVGHTRPGSYIVPIINRALLTEAPWEGDQPRLVESVEEAAFERRVVTNLARALGVLQEITVNMPNAPTGRDVHEAVGEGLSFEMCRAMERPLREGSVREISISIAWALGVAPPSNVSRAFVFPTECSNRLAEVAALLRQDRTDSQEVLYGVVVGLKSRSGDEGGRVEIEALVDGAKRLVRLDLGEREYEIARLSHKRRPVVVRGMLHRNPGRTATMDVRSFEQDLSLPFESLPTTR